MQFDIKLKSQDMYRFNMYHTYHGFHGMVFHYGIHYYFYCGWH